MFERASGAQQDASFGRLKLLPHARGLEAGKLVGELAKLVGGKGGGQKNVAQAGGKEPGKLPEALAAVLPLVRKILTGS